MTDTLQQRLTQVFKTVFGLDPIDDTVSVVTLEAWDSMAHITLIMELEKEFDAAFSLDEAIEMTSVPDIVAMLESKAIT